MARLSRSKRRAAVRAYVDRRDFDGLIAFMGADAGTPYRVLALVFEKDDDLRWRAIEALGVVGRALAAAGELERVRGLVRRLIWLMNDESGGIAWHGPEAIAELLDAVPALRSEYGRIVAAYIDEPPFGPGVHRAVARLAASSPDQFEHVVDRLEGSLTSEDPVERGYALVALAALAPSIARRTTPRLLEDPAEVAVYDRERGAVTNVTVGDLARVAAEQAGRPA